MLGVQVSVAELDDAVERILDSARSGTPLGVSALAVHGVICCVGDPELRFRVNALDLVVPDGQPVRWALGWLHRERLAERVYGPDLMDAVCGEAARAGLPVFLFGSTAETLARLVPRLQERHPGLEVAGAQPSRFRAATAAEALDDIDRIRSSGARVVLVGLGCPRQEVWAYENRDAAGMPVLAVGAAFDYHAGALRRPPAWMQRHGLEWVHRLLQEPRRLWRRYLLLNPVYLSLVALQMLGVYEIDAERARPPVLARRPG